MKMVIKQIDLLLVWFRPILLFLLCISSVRNCTSTLWGWVAAG